MSDVTRRHVNTLNSYYTGPSQSRPRQSPPTSTFSKLGLEILEFLIKLRADWIKMTQHDLLRGVLVVVAVAIFYVA